MCSSNWKAETSESGLWHNTRNFINILVERRTEREVRQETPEEENDENTVGTVL